MAEIGLGIGTSHSPMLMQPAELWANHALNDQRNKELCFAPSGEILSFEEALERAHPGIADLCNYEIHKKQKENTEIHFKIFSLMQPGTTAGAPP